ncbi:MAG: thiamine pyrophosphate-dependent enzyme [Armatimonadota bacterium]
MSSGNGWSPITPGHAACVGCGEMLAVRLALEAAGPNVIVTCATGCIEVTTTRYPQSAWNIPWIHSLFENAASVASGIYHALKAMGREDEAKVIAMGGDGATADIGIGCLSGMLERGDDVLYLCFDNEAYMNTGVQRSGLTPFDAHTTTSPSGKESMGNPTRKKDMPWIAAAHGAPYVATASPAFAADIRRKIQKALSIKGPKYIQFHSPCPLGWGFPPERAIEIAKLAVETACYPIFEIVNGELTGVRKLRNRRPVEDYLRPQARFRHLFRPGGEEELARIQAIADENARRYGIDMEPPAKQSEG